MLNEEVAAAVSPVVAEFRRLAIDFYMGGSLASSAYGHGRATQDADLVADFRNEHVAPFVATLTGPYYVSEPMIRSAIERRSCFNLIHYATMFKVDVFVLKNRPFDQLAMERAVLAKLPCSVPLELPIASPEDIVLAKLELYRKGGEISERQWLDILGILKVRGDQLDLDYLWHWSREIDVDDLLLRVLAEAGLSPPNRSVPF